MLQAARAALAALALWRRSVALELPHQSSRAGTVATAAQAQRAAQLSARRLLARLVVAVVAASPKATRRRPGQRAALAAHSSQAHLRSLAVRAALRQV